MNLDDELHQSLATAANAVNPGSPPLADLVARAQRRRRARLGALSASAAALVVVAAFLVAGSGDKPAVSVASGNATGSTAVVNGGGDGDDGAAAGTTTTTAPQSIVSSGTGYVPPASTVYPPPATTTSVPRGTTTTTEPSTGDVVVTQDDSGKTITLRQGQRLIVNLAGEGWDYTEPASDNDAVLHRVSGHADASGDATATFVGTGAGQANVTATKDAPCRKSNPPCMTPSYLFQLTVNVV